MEADAFGLHLPPAGADDDRDQKPEAEEVAEEGDLERMQLLRRDADREVHDGEGDG